MMENFDDENIKLLEEKKVIENKSYRMFQYYEKKHSKVKITNNSRKKCAEMLVGK